MTKRDRHVVIALVAVIVLTIGALLVAIAAQIFAYGDRWDQPVNFADQRATLLRSHQGLGPDEIGNSHAWRALLDDFDRITRNRITPKSPSEYPWNTRAFEFPTKPENVPLRDQLLLDYEDAGIFTRLDDLSADTRFVEDPARSFVLINLFRTLNFRTAAAIEVGDIDIALREMQRMITVARIGVNLSLFHEPLLSLLFMYRHAHDVVHSPSLSKEQAHHLSQLVESSALPSAAHCLELARLECLDAIYSTMGPSPFVPRDARAQMRRVDEVFKETIEHSRHSPAHRRAQGLSTKPTSQWHALDRIIYEPAVMMDFGDSIVAHADSAKTERLGTLVVIAIRCYQLDHDGALPISLDALVPRYLGEVPIDPFSDAPLIFKHTPDGYTLYSVGPDGVDNSGTRPDAYSGVISPSNTDRILHPSTHSGTDSQSD